MVDRRALDVHSLRLYILKARLLTTKVASVTVQKGYFLRKLEIRKTNSLGSSRQILLQNSLAFLQCYILIKIY